MSPSFAQLGVPTSICRALERRGIDQPFPIQAATIEDALAGRDVCGRAPTGSGKTLAFGIPLVATVDRARPKRPTGLVLAPTRELADQIAEELRSFAGDTRIGVVYGGVGYGGQLKTLRQGVEVLVACPGRLEDLIAQKAVDLGDVHKVVVDEADRMADMGFLPVVRRLLDQTSSERQTVLFSATLDGEVAKLTRDYQRDAVRHEVGDRTPDITTSEHRFLVVERTDRVGVAARVVSESGQAIVFCRTRHGADNVARRLIRSGVDAAAIHGGHAQNRRRRSLDSFTKGTIQALVATDVAARGIHVDDVAVVIHYDPPEDHATYIHRSGRTARAGRNGLVVSLVQPEQVADARKLQSALGLGSSLAGARTAGEAQPARTTTQRPKRSGAPRQKAGADSGGGKPSKGSAGRKPGASKTRTGAPKADGGNRPGHGPAGAGPPNRTGAKRRRRPKSGTPQ